MPRFLLHARLRSTGARRRPLRSAVAGAVALGALFAAPSLLEAWGAKGHRIAGEAAADALPADMPAFFREAKAQLAFLNPEPDRWKARAERDLDPALDGRFFPDHFLDTELASPALLAQALKAPHRFAYADSLRAGGVEVYDIGFLPFSILELTQRLRQEFRMWRSAPDSATRVWIEQRIINDAGILGHYVSDASNPAHTTIHYNGWVGENPRGFATDRQFHGRFEGAYVQAHIEYDDVRSRVTSAPRVFPDVRTAVTAYIEASRGEVERLYALDLEDAWGIDTRSAAHKAFAAERLAVGATMLRDLWYTAWITSVPQAGERPGGGDD